MKNYIISGQVDTYRIKINLFASSPSSAINVFKNKYPDENKVPRPSHWSGWNLKPEQIEFWLEIKNRIHERLNYKKENNNWVKEILYP